MAHTVLLTIEKPTAADFDEMTDVWEASVRATHHSLSETDILFYKPLVSNEFLKQVDLYCTRLANGRICGFMGIVQNSLEMLFISPDAHKNGIGRQLLNYAIKELGVTKVDVNEQNQQAVGFYLRFGFEIRSRSETDAMGKPFPILHLELARP